MSEEVAVVPAAAPDTTEKQEVPPQNNTDAEKEVKPAEEIKDKPAAKTTKPVSKNVHKTDFEKDVVYLYQFGRCPAMPQFSPFCLKVETWLRMTELKYEVVDHHLKYKSKKGQLPFVEHNGEEIADSEIIIANLAKTYNKNIDENLTSEQKIISHAFISMLNNHTSWVMRYFRFKRPDEFRKATKLDVKKETNSKLPKGVVNFFFKLRFGNYVKTTVTHGLGHHKEEEIVEFGKSDIKSLSEFLGDKSFFFGDEPALLDCEVFAHISQLWYVPSHPTFKELLENDCSNLVSFMERMKEKYWSDWDDLCKVPEPVSPKKEKPATPAAADDEKQNKEKDDAEKETSDEKEKTETDEKEKEKDDGEKKDEPKEEDNKEKEESKE